MGKKVYYTKEKGLGITGLAFIKEMRRHEKRVEGITDKALPRMGKKAPRAHAAIGRLIGQIELMACCVYGCPGHGVEAHTLQYLCGRSSSFGRAVLRLARMGFYDEALSLVRSLGEIANLLGLFFWGQNTLEEWKKSDRKYRRDHFSPAKVRDRYKKLCPELPMNDERYGVLCELSTHPVPQMTPQKFNQFDRPMTGGLFMQEAGLLVVLNETAAILACIALFAASLLKLPKTALNAVMKDGKDALKAAGAVDVTNFRKGLKSHVATAP